MKIFGKSLKEYIAAVGAYFFAAVILITITTALRLNNTYTLRAQTLTTLLGIAVLVWAGVSAVKEHGFDWRQTAFVGFLISFAAAWSLPIFHPPFEALLIFLINAILYALIATVSGLVAKRIFKRT